MILTSLGVLSLSFSLLLLLDLVGKLYMVYFKALVLISRKQPIESLTEKVHFMPIVITFGIGLLLVLWK